MALGKNTYSIPVSPFIETTGPRPGGAGGRLGSGPRLGGGGKRDLSWTAGFAISGRRRSTPVGLPSAIDGALARDVDRVHSNPFNCRFLDKYVIGDHESSYSRKKDDIPDSRDKTEIRHRVPPNLFAQMRKSVTMRKNSKFVVRLYHLLLQGFVARERTVRPCSGPAHGAGFNSAATEPAKGELVRPAIGRPCARSTHRRRIPAERPTSRGLVEARQRSRRRDRATRRLPRTAPRPAFGR